jgi:hypothetical protein
MHTLKNVSLIAAIASCFTQIGAQLFAIVVIVRTTIAAPPRSFAMLEGEYGYDSSIFWQIVPTMTLALLVVAIITNWRTTRRSLMLLSLALFLAGSAVAGVVVEPGFEKLMAAGYSDVVDVALKNQAATLYVYDWCLWFIALAAGTTLLVALARPIRDRHMQTASRSVST